MLGTASFVGQPSVANADSEEDDFFQDPEIKEIYDNPNIPKAPEERSGLVVLRVAEVAQFQEKILRSISSGEVEGLVVSPMQFLFGTQILLRNSNLDGNMRLMIEEEVPRRKRDEARKNAAAAMNQLQEIAKFSGSIQRDFETIEMVELADMYRNVRVYLNQLYELLPEKEKEKYYGYFVAVTEYEKKLAEGNYNPELDGICNLTKQNIFFIHGYTSIELYQLQNHHWWIRSVFHREHAADSPGGWCGGRRNIHNFRCRLLVSSSLLWHHHQHVEYSRVQVEQHRQQIQYDVDCLALGQSKYRRGPASPKYQSPFLL